MNQALAGSIAGFVLGLGIGLLWHDFRSSDPGEAWAPPDRSTDRDPRTREDSHEPVGPAVEDVAPGHSERSEVVTRQEATSTARDVPRAEISGRLVERDGTPVVDGTIYAIRADLPEWTSRAGRLGELDLARFASPRFGGQDSLTHVDGQFTLFGLRPEIEYVLIGLGKNVGSGELDLFVSDPANSRRVLAPADSLELIDSSGRFVVRILPDDGVRERIQNPSGSPIGSRIDLRAQLVETPGAKSSRTSSITYSRIATLEFGVRVEVDSVASLSFLGERIESVELPELRIPAERNELEVPVTLITRSVDNRLELEIVDESGAPLPTAAIAILKGIGQPDYPWCSSVQGTEAAQRELEQGRFSEERIEPGPTTLRIAAPVALGLAPVEIEFEMPERGSWLRRVVLPRGGNLRIQAESSAMPLFAVRVVAGAPPGTRVLAPITAEGAPMSNGITQYESAVTLVCGNAIAPGEYTLLYRSKGVDGAQSFSIRAGEETRLVVR